MRLEIILGSKNRVRVLRALLRKDGVCGREVGRLASLSPSAANIALSELVESRLLLRSGTIGKHSFELNRAHYLYPPIERLFEDERHCTQKIAEMVKRHFNDPSVRANWLGIGVLDGGLLLVSEPALTENDQVLRHIDSALRSEFGIPVSKTSSDISVLAGVPDVRLALPETGSSRLRSAASREKTLDFFGLKASQGRQRAAGR